MSLGNSKKKLLTDEKENRAKLRKSLVALVDIEKGTIIDSNMIGIKRPGYGIKPSEYKTIIGKRVENDIKQDSIIAYDDLQ